MLKLLKVEIKVAWFIFQMVVYAFTLVTLKIKNVRKQNGTNLQQPNDNNVVKKKLATVRSYHPE